MRQHLFLPSSSLSLQSLSMDWPGCLCQCRDASQITNIHSFLFPKLTIMEVRVLGIQKSKDHDCMETKYSYPAFLWCFLHQYRRCISCPYQRVFDSYSQKKKLILRKQKSSQNASYNEKHLFLQLCKTVQNTFFAPKSKIYKDIVLYIYFASHKF